RELFEQLALTLRQVLGQADVDLRVQIAFAVWLAEVWHALAAQAELPAVLGTGWDFEREATTVRRWHMHLTAEQHRRKRGVDAGVEVMTVAFEACISDDGRDQVQVTGRTTDQPGRPLARHPDSTAIVDAGWDFDFQSPRLPIRQLELEHAGGSAIRFGQRDLDRIFQVGARSRARLPTSGAPTTEERF